MENLIIKDGQLVEKITEQIIALELQKKAITESYDNLKLQLLNAMEKNNIISVKNDYLSISYVAETEKETFDSKQFKNDMPDLYNEYIRFSTVKPSIRIKVK